MSERGSRLRASVLTFGPVGRVVCTVVLLAVPYWFLMYAGFFGLFGAVVWIGWVLPGALRDTWRPAALPPTDLTRLRDAAALEAERLTKPTPSNPVFDPAAPPPERW